MLSTESSCSVSTGGIKGLMSLADDIKICPNLLDGGG